jgi:hypothetical protein
MFYWLEEYLKHFALNLGQTLQGLRYFYSHPDVDSIAARGSIEHFRRSLRIRSKRVLNDFFFAAIPPHWHHTPEELAGMRNVALGRWFQYGYCAWRFTETGEIKNDLSRADRRWDPRCLDPNA